MRCINTSIAIVSLFAATCSFVPALAQEEAAPPPVEELAPEEEVFDTPESVSVEPVRDEIIEDRLRNILSATDRFRQLEVRVENGVVFFRGEATTPEHKEWARQLALRTMDVVAVVNNLTVAERPLWDFGPSFQALRDLRRDVVHSLPIMAFSLVILLFALLLAFACARLAELLLRNRVDTPLLRSVFARLAGAVVLILGVYVVLQIADLTTLAATVLGGTGLIGLIIGIGFRDIAENFLASLLISMQKPFETGDAVTIDTHTGIVQKVTTRGTLLMGFDGNYIQIPNSTVYKHIIVNYTANPNTRLDFVLGIGYDSRASEAQEVALQVLRDHPAVLDVPEAMVLLENLGAATIDIRIYFWTDTEAHSILKVKSAVMRLMVRAFLNAGISLPDAAREVVFPQGVPVMRYEPDAQKQPPRLAPVAPAEADTGAAVTSAEGDLRSEVGELQQQVKHSRQPEEGRDILSRNGG